MRLFITDRFPRYKIICVLLLPFAPCATDGHFFKEYKINIYKLLYEINSLYREFHCITKIVICGLYSVLVG